MKGLRALASPALQRLSALCPVQQSSAARAEAPLWAAGTLKNHCRVVVIGGGGHGLSTAYALAKDHGLTDVMVLEQGALASGTSARPVALVRSNAVHDGSARLYEAARHVWGGSLAEELQLSGLYCPRPLLTVAQSEQEVRFLRRRVYANRRQGREAQWLSADQIAAICPTLETQAEGTLPILGASLHPQSGLVQPEALVWGYARALRRLGGEVVEHCPVRAIRIVNGVVEGVETAGGFVRCSTVVLAAATGSVALAAQAGVFLPLASAWVQEAVSLPMAPFLTPIVMSASAPVSLSQSERGEIVIGVVSESEPEGLFGAALQQAIRQVVSLFPTLSRVAMTRCWTGSIDVAPDASPILGETPVQGLFVNCGWGVGGFKAIPVAGALLAQQIVTGQVPELMQPFGLSRFAKGALIDEHGASALSAVAESAIVPTFAREMPGRVAGGAGWGVGVVGQGGC